MTSIQQLPAVAVLPCAGRLTRPGPSTPRPSFRISDLDGMGDVDLAEGPHADDVIGELEQIRYGEEKWKDDWYQLALTVEARLGWADVMATGSYMNREHPL